MEIEIQLKKLSIIKAVSLEIFEKLIETGQYKFFSLYIHNVSVTYKIQDYKTQICFHLIIIIINLFDAKHFLRTCLSFSL